MLRREIVLFPRSIVRLEEMFGTTRKRKDAFTTWCPFVCISPSPERRSASVAISDMTARFFQRV